MQTNLNHRIAIEITAERALFTIPNDKPNGEKLSYEVPTYEALKGLLKRIYWEPTILWYVDAVRVMNPIQTETERTGTLRTNSKDSKYTFITYLTNVKYQVLAHYEWNMNYPECANDRDYGRYNVLITRMIQAGGRHPLYLGSKKCRAYITPCIFGDGEGAYDHSKTQIFSNMYHGQTYPDECYEEEAKDILTVNYFDAQMEHGIITFPRPEECPIHYTRRK